MTLPAETTEDITLPILTSNSSTISWEVVTGSSNITNTGVITQGATNVTVTLRATISNNNISKTKEFDIVIVGSNLGNYYSSISTTANANVLKSELRSLITTTHTYQTSYEDCKTYLSLADAIPNNSSKIMLFYSATPVDKDWVTGGITWNREHVWCKSLSWYTSVDENDRGAGADLHHIRPTDPTINSTRSNMPFGEIDENINSGTTIYLDKDTKQIVAGKYYNNVYEPIDAVKGDVARIIFYLMTRYTESDSFAFTNIVAANSNQEAINLLLSWNQLDPVDDLEMNRNNVIFDIQGNRNPFIDNQNYAQMIWG